VLWWHGAQVQLQKAAEAAQKQMAALKQAQSREVLQLKKQVRVRGRSPAAAHWGSCRDWFGGLDVAHSPLMQLLLLLLPPAGHQEFQSLLSCFVAPSNAADADADDVAAADADATAAAAAAAQTRKDAAKLMQYEAMHAKQQAVLKRKTQEAEAARKRLKVCVAALLSDVAAHSGCRGAVVGLCLASRGPWMQRAADFRGIPASNCTSTVREGVNKQQIQPADAASSTVQSTAFCNLVLISPLPLCRYAYHH
jgi:hypothetical protein